MPKDRRKYTSAHDQSLRINKRRFAVSNTVEHVEVGERAHEDATEVLTSMSGHPEKLVISKKEKQQLKHETFLKRLQLSNTPYSRSHLRRVKRKAREQLASGLEDLSEALPALGDEGDVEYALVPPKKASSDAMDTDTTTVEAAKERKEQRQRADGLIGEGKSEPLSKRQRKRVLQVEKIRQPLLIAAPEFAASPFEALRIHAQNTLLKHKPST